MAGIKGPISGAFVDVDTTPKALRNIIYGSDGQILAKVDKTPSAITPGSSPGLLIESADYKTPRLVRGMSDGSLADGRPTLLWYDPVEAAAVNTNLWTQYSTTMTAATATGVITFNSGSSVATTVGFAQVGQRGIPLVSRSKVLFRSRQRHTAHSNNNLIETGLINIATPSATTTLQAQNASGAVWQKDGTGQYIPSLFLNGSLTVGAAISNAVIVAAIPATNYAVFEVEVDPSGATFRIVTTDGILVNEQRIDFPAGTGDWTVTHFFPYVRTYNSAAVGTAVQLLITDSAVYGLDIDQNKPWPHVMSGMGYSFIQSPTAFTQMANYANNTAPTARTPTNTTALEATLGGQVLWSNGANMFAASDTLDLILFGQQIPTPYTFIITGVRIATLNLGAAVAGTPTTIQYSLAVGSNAVSLATAAPNAPRFVPLGFQSAPVAAAIGQPYDRDIDHTFSTPIAVQAGHFIHLVGRVIVGTATASQTARTVAVIEGYFE